MIRFFHGRCRAFVKVPKPCDFNLLNVTAGTKHQILEYLENQDRSDICNCYSIVEEILTQL